MDAAARGLKHPKLWGLLAANGNNFKWVVTISNRSKELSDEFHRQQTVSGYGEKEKGSRYRVSVCGCWSDWIWCVWEELVYKAYIRETPKVQKENADIHQNALA